MPVFSNFFFWILQIKYKGIQKKIKWPFFFIFFIFYFSGLLMSTAPRADVIIGKAARVKVTDLNFGSRVKPWARVPVEWTGACRRVQQFLVARFLGWYIRWQKMRWWWPFFESLHGDGRSVIWWFRCCWMKSRDLLGTGRCVHRWI